MWLKCSIRTEKRFFLYTDKLETSFIRHAHILDDSLRRHTSFSFIFGSIMAFSGWIWSQADATQKRDSNVWKGKKKSVGFI